MNFQELKIPATWEESLVILDRFMPSDELEYIHASSDIADMIVYHDGLGRMMRNYWGLWGDSELKNDLTALGFTHPDDMSGFILDSYWNYRHSIPNDADWVKCNVEKYAEHWRIYRNV